MTPANSVLNYPRSWEELWESLDHQVPKVTEVPQGLGHPDPLACLELWDHSGSREKREASANRARRGSQASEELRAFQDTRAGREARGSVETEGSQETRA